MQIKGVFFDLGGTLFTYGVGLGGGGIEYVIGATGLKAKPRDIGKAWMTASAEVGAHYGAQSYFLHKNLFLDTLTQFLATFDHEPSPELAEEFHLRQRDSLVEHLQIRDECHDALAALKSKGLYLSIVSNIDDDYLYPLVEKHSLAGVLDDCTSSEEARSCKPDTGIFHYALKKSGFQPEEVLFVGDSLHHDVAGADAVGMPSARIVEEGVETPLTHGLEVTADPTYEITALTDLVELVGRHNDG